MTSLRITTLVEDTASERGVLGEHGLAFWIETANHRVLFDTGQTPEVLCHNAEHLNISPSTADAIVLSHGHYDHTGGLADVLSRTHRPRLFLHPAALQRRFSRHQDGSVQDVSMPATFNEEKLRDAADLVWTQKPTQLVPGLFVTGQIPRITNYEDTGGDFYLDENGDEPDPIADDQAIYFDTLAGLVIVLGCAHAGVINTLNHIRRLTDRQPIRAVIGGMHLLHASPERMDQTVAALREFNAQRLVPTHCTGAHAAARLWQEFPKAWQPCPVGTTFEFQGVVTP